MQSESRVIFWAVDPYELEQKPDPELLRAFIRWAATAGYSLLPVFVLPPFAPGELAGNTLDTESAQRQLDEYIESFQLESYQPPELVYSISPEKEDAADALIAHAEEKDPAWIMVSSHGRSGIGGFVFGSFAESLLQKSSRPVVFLNRKEPWRKITGPNALFPTDFTKAARAAFRQFLPLARRLGLGVTLFHAVPLPLSPAAVEAPAVYIPEEALGDQSQEAEVAASEWVEEGRLSGVEVKVKLETGELGFLTGESILSAARQVGTDLIVMASGGSRLDRILFGDVAKEVLLAGLSLTWVYGPAAISIKGASEAA